MSNEYTVIPDYLVGKTICVWFDNLVIEADITAASIGNPLSEMVPYSMRDYRWRDFEFDSGYTLGNAGCYVVGLCSILSHYGYRHTPDYLARQLRDLGTFCDGELIKPELVREVYRPMFFVGRWDWPRVPADISYVARMLSYGPQLLQIDMIPGGQLDRHFVVGIGFTSDGNDIWIIDPWDGARTRLLERYAKADWDLARAVYGLRVFQSCQTQELTDRAIG